MSTNLEKFESLDRRFTELEKQKEKFIDDLKDNLKQIIELHTQVKNTLKPLIT